MQYRGINELREMFLRFFEGKEHHRMESFSLVPSDDKSLLLINSGMAPLKKYFLGQVRVKGNRATTCQKCIRTPDIERVGKTSRHGTFFEMLGNFSFGDYFKKEAIAWAWEFMTEVVGMPKEKLYCSVFMEDDEAFDIWTKQVGVPTDHMVRLGREDNFWEIGSGPCGPCSEIYYDRGEQYGCGSTTCAPGCDCDRYVEVWNLVFTQFMSDGNGHYTPLEKPNIDTGMGLERLGCMVQGVDNLFEVDTIQNIMRHIEQITGVSYKAAEQSDISLRVITDHIRSTVFLVGDGVVPANEGRGYVLRRLLRRAARHGRLLGVEKPFLYTVCETVIDENRLAYPDLAVHRAYITKVIRAEEERFEKTINTGLALVEEEIDKMRQTKTDVMPGEAAFRLNDTYGFPIDLIREMLEDQGYGVDMEGFNACMQEQKMRAREDAKKKDTSWESDLFNNLDVPKTVFTGYDALQAEATIVFLAGDGRQIKSAGEGDKIQIIFDKTPFYAEGGGQVGDSGVFATDDARVNIVDCQKTAAGYYVHSAVVTSGCVKIHETGVAAVDEEERRSIMRNHTGAHLLQQALREVLGEQVRQSGSYVDSGRLRFDFSHFKAVKGEELRQIEQIVNRCILNAVEVRQRVLPIEEAKKEGALALFGEKYGDTVRVIDVVGFSKEFCGGTHVGNTAHLGLFKILSESSVAAGIRRIEATTGWGILRQMDSRQAVIDEIGTVFKTMNAKELPARAKAVTESLREAEHVIEHMRIQLAEGRMEAALRDAADIDGLRVVGTRIDLDANVLRMSAQQICDKEEGVIVALLSHREGKVSVCVACGTAAIGQGYRAGEIVKKLAAVVGGTGGGKANIAMAGGKDSSKIDDALKALPQIIRTMK